MPANFYASPCGICTTEVKAGEGRITWSGKKSVVVHHACKLEKEKCIPAGATKTTAGVKHAPVRVKQIAATTAKVVPSATPKAKPNARSTNTNGAVHSDARTASSRMENLTLLEMMDASVDSPMTLDGKLPAGGRFVNGKWVKIYPKLQWGPYEKTSDDPLD